MTEQRIRVLVVEDTYDCQMIFKAIMEFFAIEMSAAHNGIEALDVLNESVPDVVVMDLDMPVMDGWQTLEAIRQDTALAHLPVVAVTAYGSPEVEASTRQAGFDGYFPKPINPSEFVDYLIRLLR
nr:response regulator [Anaerolineae bacterium]